MSSTLDRIKKLLAVANNDAASENEAETARRLAERLMEAVGISEEEIRNSTLRGEDPAATVRREQGDRKTSSWKGIVAVAVSRMVNCYVYVDSYTKRLQWVGTDSQRESAKELYSWIVKQIDRMTKSAVKGRGKSWAQSYRQGVSNAIAKQARELVAERLKNHPQTSEALVVQDRIQQAIRACLPKLNKSKTSSAADGEAFSIGMMDGKTVKLRREMGVPASRMLTA